MSEPLSQLERQVYLYLIDFLAEHTYQPSVRDIAKEFGIKSTKTVAALMQSLARKGYIERESTRSRGVRLVGLSAPARMIPVPRYARLADSRPALRDENRDGHVTFDRSFITNADVFVFVTDRECAAGAAALVEGDYTLIDPSSPATDGALVLARVGDRAMIRTIQHRGPTTVLHSADSEAAEIQLGPTSDFEIVGVVCGVLRGKEGLRGC